MTVVPVVRLTLGWLPDDGATPQLLPWVATAEGPLVYVKASPDGMTRTSIDLGLPVPALLPAGGRTWDCPRCGARNVGGQEQCLRCQTPAPPASGVPSPGPVPGTGSPAVTGSAGVTGPGTTWAPTHTVPPEGMAWFHDDGSPGGQLDPGLPLAVVQSSGDWARIVAENGWMAWVDARLLRPR